MYTSKVQVNCICYLYLQCQVPLLKSRIFFTKTVVPLILCLRLLLNCIRLQISVQNNYISCTFSLAYYIQWLSFYRWCTEISLAWPVWLELTAHSWSLCPSKLNAFSSPIEHKGNNVLFQLIKEMLIFYVWCNWESLLIFESCRSCSRLLHV